MDFIDLSKVFFKPEEYLVFWIKDLRTRPIRVIRGSDLVYTDESNKQIQVSNQNWKHEFNVSLYKRELFIDNKKAYGVRWFEVSNDVAKVLGVTKYIRSREYLLTLCTFGIWGCYWIKRKNKALLNLQELVSSDNDELLSLRKLSEDYLKTDKSDDFAKYLSEEEPEILISLKDKFGSLNNIRETLENIRQENFESAKRLVEKYLYLYSVEDKLRQFDEIEKKWQDYESNLTLDDAKEFKNLRDSYGAPKKIEELLSSMEDMQMKDTEISKHKEQIKKWIELAGGKNIDHMLELKRKKDNENSTLRGTEFEKRIEKKLNSFREKNYDSFAFKSQKTDPESKKRSDFSLMFTNKREEFFRAVVECKSSPQLEELENFGYEDLNQNKQLKDGLSQLCKYYQDHVADIGFLVVDSKVLNIDVKGFMRVPAERVPEKYSRKIMNLYIVHEKYFSPLLEILGCINKSYNPSPKPQLSIDQKEQIISQSPWVGKLLEVLQKIRDDDDPIATRYLKQVETCSRAFNKLEEIAKKWLEAREETKKKAIGVCQTIEIYSAGNKIVETKAKDLQDDNNIEAEIIEEGIE